MNKTLLTTKKYLFDFIKMQIIVTAIALPILIKWGLPLSLMTFVGNFIFTPVLTVFLITSSLIFLTELLAIPNALLCSILELTASLWEYILLLGKKSWLIGFREPPKIILLLMALLIALFIFRFVFKDFLQADLILSRIVTTGIIVCTLGMFINYYVLNPNKHPHKNTPTIVPFTKQKLLIKHYTDKVDQLNGLNPSADGFASGIHIIDDGFFNKKFSPEKFVIFSLRPYLIKKYGTTKISSVTINKPSSRSFRAVEELLNTFSIKTVAIAYFKKPLSKYGYKKYFDLKKRVKKEGTRWKRFKKPSTKN